MSAKKATPKAVFDACEQLELLEQPWNRDDVRTLVGGGSFSVIDPLIQAWRKLQPVREVAPTVPTDLLIQMATMLEQQVSSYIEDVESRDQQREEALLALNETASKNFAEIEAELEANLDVAEQSNHQLEAELARLDSDLRSKDQQINTLELELKVSKESNSALSNRQQEQKAFYETTLTQQKAEFKQSMLDETSRAAQAHQQQMSELKLENQQQLARQKSELLEAAEVAENRLMRLLDESRSELKELARDSAAKIDSLSHDLQTERQLVNSQRLEIKSLEGSLVQYQKNAEEVQERLNQENELLKKKLLDLKNEGSVREQNDLQQLKESIRLLQEQVQRK